MRYLNNWKWGILALLIIGISSCEKDEDLNSDLIAFSDFKNDADGWTGGFAEYSTSMEGQMEFELNRKNLPSPLDQSQMAMKIEGRNLSDNMFMYMKKKISGLDPNQTYAVNYEIVLASNYPDNSVGIGGSPATSVFLKGGASPEEPKKYLEDDYYMINLDKGVQSQGGTQMHVLGHVGAGDDIEEYKLITRSNPDDPVEVKPNANGDHWLVVGTDSGFEGKTILYYDRITALLRPIDN